MEEKIYQYVRQIPKGKVSTYKFVAEAVGSPKAFRAVGTILAKNKYPLEVVSEDDPMYVPCHRVIKSTGEIGGFFGDLARYKDKQKILESEGVIITKNSKIDLKRYLWTK